MPDKHETMAEQWQRQMPADFAGPAESAGLADLALRLSFIDSNAILDLVDDSVPVVRFSDGSIWWFPRRRPTDTTGDRAA